MRHVCRTHGIGLDWLFERIMCDRAIKVKYIPTKMQIADVFTKGSFTAYSWKSLCEQASIKLHVNTPKPKSLMTHTYSFLSQGSCFVSMMVPGEKTVRWDPRAGQNGLWRCRETGKFVAKRRVGIPGGYRVVNPPWPNRPGRHIPPPILAPPEAGPPEPPRSPPSPCLSPPPEPEYFRKPTRYDELSMLGDSPQADLPPNPPVYEEDYDEDDYEQDLEEEDSTDRPDGTRTSRRTHVPVYDVLPDERLDDSDRPCLHPDAVRRRMQLQQQDYDTSDSDEESRNTSDYARAWEESRKFLETPHKIKGGSWKKDSRGLRDHPGIEEGTWE